MNRTNSRATTTHTDESINQASVSKKQMVKDVSISTTTTEKDTFSKRWTAAIKYVTNPVLQGMHLVTKTSALNPKTTIVAVVMASVLLLVVGLFTNFKFMDDIELLWTPIGSYPAVHKQWIKYESGFPTSPRKFHLIFHENGNADTINRENINKIFQALDAVRALEDFNTVCLRGVENVTGLCEITGITKFWNHSSTIIASSVTSETDLIEQISVLIYPYDSTPVVLDGIIGNYVRDNKTGLLVSAQNYHIDIAFPDDKYDDTVTSKDFERKALRVVFQLQEQWKNGKLKIEVFAERSFSDEFGRAIVNDIPLVPIVFIIMCIFTCILFFQRDKVQSRCLLGFMAVVSILLSTMAGYGIMFICAIPITSMTQMLPFVFFGVGLDDALIISGSYFRLDPTMNVVDRVATVIDEIGLSIFLTTLTSALAFGLGFTSSIPAVYWLCLYAVPTIILILLFQLTFFIGCLVLDERRIQSKNRDAFRCISCGCKQEGSTPNETSPVVVPMDLFKYWLIQKLLIWRVKVIVIVAFIALVAGCCVSVTNLRQQFDFTDVLPSDSYIRPFFAALHNYSARSSIAPYVYFRNVDQSDAEIQKQMETFVSDLVKIDSIVKGPDFFWLRDFKSYVFKLSNTTNGITDISFNDRVTTFLSDPKYFKLYNSDIIRDVRVP